MQKVKKNIAERLNCELTAVLGENQFSVTEILDMLEYPPENVVADLAFPCFKFSKLLRKSPQMIAQMLSEKFEQSEIVEKTECAGGYLNFCIKKEYFSDSVLNTILSEGDKYGSADLGQGKTIVLDYLVAYTLLGFGAGLFKNKPYVATVVGSFLRFVAHYFSGALIWGEWMPESFLKMKNN